jgi:hypothetical protein
MPGVAPDQAPDPESTEPESAGPESREPDSPPRKRSRAKRILTPLVLAAVGLTLFLLAIIVYPSATELPTAPSSTLAISTNVPLSTIWYEVDQISPGTARVLVEAVTAIGLPLPKRVSGKVVLLPPYGTAFQTCPHPACEVFPSRPRAYEWLKPLVFNTCPAYGPVLQLGPSPVCPAGIYGIEIAKAFFYVKAPSLGVTYNGVTASAVIPEIQFQAPETGATTLVTHYHIPSASSYDWSSFPASAYPWGSVGWHETVTSGITESRAAVGINHAAQTSNDNKTFFAGALIGLAGGAILSAVQEALHAGD